MNEVLAALKEVIIAETGKEHEPSPTEYFATIIATLKSSVEIDHLNEMLQLLEAIIPQANQAVVLSQFGVIRDICVQVLETTSSIKTQYYCLSALGRVMKVQDTSEKSWNSAKSFKLLNVYLAFLDYETPLRVRKIAGTRLCELLHHHKQHNTRSVRSYVADFCTSVFDTCQRNDYKRSLCVVEFLQSSLACFNEQDIVKIYESALILQECEQPILIAELFKMVDCFFQSPYLTLSANSLCDKILIPLMSSGPKTNDMESIGFFCTAIASGMTKIHRLDREICIRQLVPCIQSLLLRCEADYTQIHCAVGTALKRIIRTCVDSSLVRENVQLLKMSTTFGRDGISSPLITFLDNLLEIIELRYQNAWIYILDAVRALFHQITGDDSRALLVPFVEKIADTYQAVTAGFITVPTTIDLALKETLGASLKSLGVVHFLQAVPLRVDPSSDFDSTTDIDSSRDWIINILHSFVKSMSCRLCDFHDVILVTAKVYNSEVKSTAHDSPKRHILRTKVIQLWSLFPSFCSGSVTDVTSNFELFVPILRGAMSDVNYPEISFHVVSGLSFLLRGAKDRCPAVAEVMALERNGDTSKSSQLTSDVVALRKHSSQFLPLLVTQIESLDVADNTRFQPVLQCICAWTSVSPQNVTTKLSKKILQSLLKSSTAGKSEAIDSGDNSPALMAVILTMIPYLSDSMIILLYRTVKPLLSVHETVGMQKRAYSVLSTLLAHHSTLVNGIDSRLHILGMITSSLLTCHVSARSIRMRCIESLLKGICDESQGVDNDEEASGLSGHLQDEEIMFEACQSVFGEVLICLKDSNKKSRDAALDLLKTIYGYTTVEQVLPQLFSGIVAETSGMRSAVIIGLCILIAQKRDDHILMESIYSLAPTIMLLLQEQCVEQTRAILTFLKVCVTALSENMLVELMPLLLPSILGDGLGAQLKARFSQRVKSIIRKLSQRLHEGTIRPHIPESDIPLLDYVCKQARRSRKKKDMMLYNQKLERMMIGDSDEDDVDSSDDENGSSASGQRKPKGHQRVKALKSNEIMETNELPSNLDDLLEGGYKVPSSYNKFEGRKSGSESHLENDEDDEYLVQVNKDGQVLVVPKLAKEPDVMEVVDEEKDMNSIQAAKAAKALAISNATGVEPLAKKRSHEPGEEYRSKKAGGDVWKKGMLEPHAYFPLDAKLLTKKNQEKAVSHIGIAVNGQSTKTNKRQKIASLMKQQNKGRAAQTLSRKQKKAAMKGRHNVK